MDDAALVGGLQAAGQLGAEAHDVQSGQIAWIA
jgi:hypothetical protein